MSGAQRVQGMAERLIRMWCRRLPEAQRSEYVMEWSAELPAILQDRSVRLPFMRAARALRFAAGVCRTARYLRRAVDNAPRPRDSGWRNGAMPVRPTSTGSRLAIGATAYLAFLFTFVSLLRAFPRPGGWIVFAGLALAAAFDACCLADIVRARRVRYLPKWAWALICLAQAPAGGIAYLCVGRVGLPGPTSSRPAPQP